MVTRLPSLSGLALAALLLPLSLSGQAFCAGPHSAGSLSQGGSIKSLPPGGGWVQLSVYRQGFDQFYNQNGELQDFLASGEFLTRSVFLTASVGVVEGLDVWAQLPVHNLRVENQAFNTTSSGVGDFQFSARITPELFGSDVPVGLRFGSKFPAGAFPVDATVLPLTEGQRDWAVSLESGWTFDFLPIYVDKALNRVIQSLDELVPASPVGSNRSVVAFWHQPWVPRRTSAACATQLSARFDWRRESSSGA